MSQPLPPYDAIPAAWASLSPEVQTDLGCMLLEWTFASFVAGDVFAEENRYCNEAIRNDAARREHTLLNAFDEKIWALFPDLFGPDDGDPAWAWRDLNELGQIVGRRSIALEAARWALTAEQKRGGRR